MTLPQQHIFVHPSGDLIFISNFITDEEEKELLKSLYGSANNSQSTTSDNMEDNTCATSAPRLSWVQLNRRRLLNLGGTPGSSDTSSSVVKASAMIPEPLPRWALEPVGSRLLAISSTLQNLGAKVDSHSIAHPTALPKETLVGFNLCASRNPDSLAEAVGALLARIPAQPAAYRLVSSTINHILVNEYLKPNGILGHEDGPQYEPIVSIVSLEGPVMLQFESKAWRRAKGEAAASAHLEKSEERLTSLSPPEGAILEVYLPPRSLVLFRGSFYTDYLHSVPECEIDTYHENICLNYAEVLRESGADEVKRPSRFEVSRAPRRVSFTYRRVLAVAKLSAAALFGRRR